MDFALPLLVLVILLSASAEGTTCKVPEGKTGPKSSIQLLLWDCIQATSSSKPACGGKYATKTKLKKGDTEKSLGFRANNVEVKAKFFGKEVCVSYMYKYIKKGVNAESYERCESSCFDYDEEERETYIYDVFCSYSSCGGSRHRMKFTSGSTFVSGRIGTLMAALILWASMVI